MFMLPSLPTIATLFVCYRCCFHCSIDFVISHQMTFTKWGSHRSLTSFSAWKGHSCSLLTVSMLPGTKPSPQLSAGSVSFSYCLTNGNNVSLSSFSQSCCVARQRCWGCALRKLRGAGELWNEKVDGGETNQASDPKSGRFLLPPISGVGGGNPWLALNALHSWASGENNPSSQGLGTRLLNKYLWNK